LAADWFKALARKRRAPATRETYRTPLRHLGRWLEDEGIDDPNLLDRQVLDHWQDTLVSLRAKTHSVYAGAIRGLLRWAAREGRVQPGLADWIEAPQVPHHEPLVLEREQLDAVAARFQATPWGDLKYLRDRALFWFLVTSSARISEVLRLDLAEVDQRRWVVVQKGGGEKTLVISTVARAWLAQYLAARGKDREPALWIYVGSVAGRRRRLTRSDANRIWQRLAVELGIPRFTSRYLRGTSATELNELQNTPIDVAHHLGHRNLATVLKYAKLRERRRQAMVDGLDQLLPPLPAAPVRRGRPRGRK
jgi:site-specific recombinase XerD